MVASARSRLGLIDERFVGAGLTADRARLHEADVRLAQIQAGLRDQRPETASLISAWLTASRPLEAALAARQPATLFDPARLAAAAKRRLPG